MTHQIPKKSPGEEFADNTVAARLDQARRRRAECLATREELRDLLAKAERRRVSEPEQRQKWEQVIAGLESSYAEVRVRLEQNETAIRLCERELASVGVVAAEDEADERPVEEEKPQPPAASAEDSTLNLQQILEMPIEDLRKLNLEQLGQLCSELEHRTDLQRDARCLRARLEFANQLNRGGRPIELNEPGQEQRRQLILRAAIDKIQTNRLHELNQGEVQLIIQCRRQLSSRLNPSERDLRLLGLLGGAMARLLDAGKVLS